VQPCGIHVYREVPGLSHSSEPRLVLLLALLIVSLLAELSQFHTDLVSPAASRRGAPSSAMPARRLCPVPSRRRGATARFTDTRHSLRPAQEPSRPQEDH
jgi:hypothetical protein